MRVREVMTLKATRCQGNQCFVGEGWIFPGSLRLDFYRTTCKRGRSFHPQCFVHWALQLEPVVKALEELPSLDGADTGVVLCT